MSVTFHVLRRQLTLAVASAMFIVKLNIGCVIPDWGAAEAFLVAFGAVRFETRFPIVGGGAWLPVREGYVQWLIRYLRRSCGDRRSEYELTDWRSRSSGASIELGNGMDVFCLAFGAVKSNSWVSASGEGITKESSGWGESVAGSGGGGPWSDIIAGVLGECAVVC